MNLEKRIYKNIGLISILVFFITLLLTVNSFKEEFFDKEKEYLQKQMEILVDNIEIYNIEKLDEFIENQSDLYRITLISSNGDVIYDSATDKDLMDNHLNRPEIVESIKNNHGESTRYSNTLNMKTYNYATITDNGDILRLSKAVDSLYVLLLKTLFRNITGITLAAMAILVVARRISNIIVEPIKIVSDDIYKDIDKEAINLESYDELSSLMNKLKKQDDDMRKVVAKLKSDAIVMKNITSNMKEGIILMDNNKLILDYNESGIKHLDGDITRNYKNSNILVLCRNIDLYKGIEDTFEKRLGQDVLIKEDLTFKNVFINPVIDNRELIGLVLFIVDVTEQKKAEKMRREFSANVSHELKSPLTSINGYAEMISEGIVSDGEEIKKFAGIINKEGNRLLELINGIIRLSQLEERKDTLDEFKVVNVKSLIEEIILRFEDLRNERDINLNVDLEYNEVLGNEVMIEEMLSNLIENGIKHSKAKNLDIRLYKDGYNVNISIKDDGIGISKEDTERIFERFYIVDESRTKENNSTGLGLSIVKHIAEYHKAKIRIESEINVGTEIIINFPIKTIDILS